MLCSLCLHVLLCGIDRRSLRIACRLHTAERSISEVDKVVLEYTERGVMHRTLSLAEKSTRMRTEPSKRGNGTTLTRWDSVTGYRKPFMISGMGHNYSTILQKESGRPKKHQMLWWDRDKGRRIQKICHAGLCRRHTPRTPRRGLLSDASCH